MKPMDLQQAYLNIDTQTAIQKEAVDLGRNVNIVNQIYIDTILEDVSQIYKRYRTNTNKETIFETERCLHQISIDLAVARQRDYIYYDETYEPSYRQSLNRYE